MKTFSLTILLITNLLFSALAGGEIPLPEHPRPDFERLEWINLNGTWDFAFDKDNLGTKEKWFELQEKFDREIMVPFPWGSPLSGLEDLADIGWYKRTISIPEDWKDRRVFIVIGASDWHNQLWIDGQYVGDYQGGYTPFEFDLTEYVSAGHDHTIVLRVDDTDHAFKLGGKQGYGNARGIWQTPYLEARGDSYIEYLHVTPDIDQSTITVSGNIVNSAGKNGLIRLTIEGMGRPAFSRDFDLFEDQGAFSFAMQIPDQRLWTLDDPYLYTISARLENRSTIHDEVRSYFGMRKIGVTTLPGTDHPYVSLNNKPVYLQMALDQAYHPEGFYTFPTDEFMRDEIIRSKKIGLNGQRIHVKVGIPRKLYWADRLGLLIMADVPNSWGRPTPEMRAETETALKGMIKRDYNHPSIFSWVIFNETWGLFSLNEQGSREYLPETQLWVNDMYQLTKKLDPTRLVEDNSPCNYDHVDTDLNTWHAYLPGYEWKGFLDNVAQETYPGSGWNFINEYTQKDQPNINSECGNVWGYNGSTGDVDWSYDYHIMINEFRKHPLVAGWLYTEHHDVINEWNGYYKFDRTMKYTGLEAFNGMTLNDLHNPIQLTPMTDLVFTATPGEKVEVPLWLSVFTDELSSGEYIIKYYCEWVNDAGKEFSGPYNYLPKFPIEAWQQGEIATIEYRVPDEEGLLIMNIELATVAGTTVHRNFVAVRMKGKKSVRKENVVLLPVDPAAFTEQQWSLKQWNVLDSLKVNGAGHGFFSYRVDVPESLSVENIREAVFRIEISSKELFGKDREDSGQMSGDYMRGKGTHDPSRNPNAYPMTDDIKHSSFARIRINDEVIKEVFLPDDPADHRGLLSWYSQPRDRQLREAGSYGYLVEAEVPGRLIEAMLSQGSFTLILEVPEIDPGGLAIYGKDFGRYPIDPSFVFYLNKE